MLVDHFVKNVSLAKIWIVVSTCGHRDIISGTEPKIQFFIMLAGWTQFVRKYHLHELKSL